RDPLVTGVQTCALPIFNEKMFNFNYKVDRFVLKPVAKVYNEIVLDGEKQAIHNAYDNVAMPKRFINSLVQGKFKGAGLELSRFRSEERRVGKGCESRCA